MAHDTSREITTNRVKVFWDDNKKRIFDTKKASPCSTPHCLTSKSFPQQTEMKQVVKYNSIRKEAKNENKKMFHYNFNNYILLHFLSVLFKAL